MILGMSTASFTLLHVIISLIGIGAGLVVLLGMFKSNRLEGWTAIFLKHHSVNQRDWVHVSFGKDWAAAHRRRYIACGAGDRPRRALHVSPRGIVALDLRRHCSPSALSQRVRRGRANISEGAILQRACADTVGTAVCHRARARAVGLYCSRLLRGKSVPSANAYAGAQPRSSATYFRVKRDVICNERDQEQRCDDDIAMRPASFFDVVVGIAGLGLRGARRLA